MHKQNKTKIRKSLIKIGKYLLKNKANLLLGLLILTFSSYIMFSTFGYKDGNFVLATKLWSDFINHVPLMRSFSYGWNFPPELPLFAHEPIRYHFVFYMIVGLLEKIGIRLDIALNVLSTAGMVGLLIAVYKMSIKIFRAKIAGFLSIILFILNPALNVIYYFLTGEKKLDSIWDLFSTKVFAAFGPYDDNIIQAFWNWNIWTNQRHFAFSLALMFLAVWLVIYCKKKYAWIIGALIIGLMAWFHKAVFLILLISLVAHFFVKGVNKANILKALVGGILLSLFGIMHLNTGGTDIRIHLGYAYQGTSWWEFPNVTSLNEKWIIFWILNLGFLPLYALLGFAMYLLSYPIVKSSKHKIINIYNRFVNKYTIWFYIALLIFVIANIFAFSIDINANHKLINVVIIIFSIYAAGFLYFVFKEYKILLILFVIPIILGGILDMFPIFNDSKVNLADISNDDKAKWIVNETDPKDVFLNLSGSTSSISISGRKVYYGPAYFTWSNGYKLGPREKKITDFIRNMNDHDHVCSFLKEEDLDFIWALDNDEEKFSEELIKISDLKKHMVLVSDFPNDGLLVFSVDKSCPR